MLELSCGKCESRELATLNEKSTSIETAKPYARDKKIEGKNRGGGRDDDTSL